MRSSGQPKLIPPRKRGNIEDPASNFRLLVCKERRKRRRRWSRLRGRSRPNNTAPTPTSVMAYARDHPLPFERSLYHPMSKSVAQVQPRRPKPIPRSKRCGDPLSAGASTSSTLSRPQPILPAGRRFLRLILLSVFNSPRAFSQRTSSEPQVGFVSQQTPWWGSVKLQRRGRKVVPVPASALKTVALPRREDGSSSRDSYRIEDRQRTSHGIYETSGPVFLKAINNRVTHSEQSASSDSHDIAMYVIAVCFMTSKRMSVLEQIKPHYPNLNTYLRRIQPIRKL
ncbi:hypothetical protein B0T26DRAFT_181954 [Lasiosphaeria miniovina]|uniref:Uncharacterized protein n=1 Tax=Lasiosphaeria miniovina TaxID=1954250 RepID=A0AA40E593_9PEZI|nr:uncharacterized protein B0T26DRAFT_181954 [Lasiosphaeria miniovina]KAK0728674.1 hypothetical protein B0T26DRAFT_181954 [Lasiosphaeria miniovina]